MSLRAAWVGLVCLAIGLAAGLGRAEGVDLAEIGATSIGPNVDSPGLWCLRPSRRESQAAYERELGRAIEAGRLGAYHDVLAGEPHPAGSEGDLRVIEFMRDEFERMGLDVEVQWIDVFLARPIVGEVEIVRRDGETVRVDLPVMEQEVDEFSGDSRLDFGWNAYSGSGEVTGEVVYANYATKGDFERLAEMGIDCAGKIVIARYGSNFRGYKAKFAAEAGAAGLIIYSDPKNVGYVRGLMYPEGGWANETQIQRGSIKTLAYVGDPLTPGEPAIAGTERLDPDEVALPRIPVQPVGWAAAEPILASMRGSVVPEEWQGGLGFNYRLEGGEGLRVRLKVEQSREMMRTANVVGRLRGTKFPEQTIVVGCHHDAWTHGAGDPTAGLIVVMEMARGFSELAARGHRPDRSILFAGWAAEEYGIIGSTEWVEQHAEDLSRSCVAYLNLDMAAMGPNFGASGAPLLKSLIADATRDVEQVGRLGTSVYEAWDQRDDERTLEQQIGSLGGGSDHVGFYCHLGIPSMSMGAGGSKGVSYHSAYDNLAWYRQVVGDDYEPAVMVARVANIAVARLANADVVPFDLVRYAVDLREHVGAAERRAEALEMTLSTSSFRTAIDRYEESAQRLARTARDMGAQESPDEGVLDSYNRHAIDLERRWTRNESRRDDPSGLPGRPWFRNLYVAPDRDSGYASWMLPDLRHWIEDHDQERANRASKEYALLMLSLGQANLREQLSVLERMSQLSSE